MAIYHRHLDHAWQATRKQVNYSLFGNERGDVVATTSPNWGPAPTPAELRASYWWAMHCVETARVRRNLVGADARREAVTWLRYKECEQ